jgi:hypothetical protein
MERLNKKYIEDFEKLERTWEKCLAKPTPILLEQLRKDLAEVEYGINHINL